MDLALNEEHDLFLSDRDISLTSEDNEVAQNLKIRLQFILSEWFLDNTVGLPYSQTILERNTNIATIYSLFRNEIKDTDKVKDIIALNITPNANERTIDVSFTVTQDKGSQISQEITIGI